MAENQSLCDVTKTTTVGSLVPTAGMEGGTGAREEACGSPGTEGVVRWRPAPSTVSLIHIPFTPHPISISSISCSGLQADRLIRLSIL